MQLFELLFIPFSVLMPVVLVVSFATFCQRKRIAGRVRSASSN